MLLIDTKKMQTFFVDVRFGALIFLKKKFTYPVVEIEYSFNVVFGKLCRALKEIRNPI